MNQDDKAELVSKALDKFRIEIPLLAGFARHRDARFGKFVQVAAATSIEEKFARRSADNLLTRVSPVMGLHVEWTFRRRASVPLIRALEKNTGFAPDPSIRISSSHRNTNLGRSATRMRKYGRRRLRTCLSVWKLPGQLDRRNISPWVCRWLELSGNAEYPAAHRLDGMRSLVQVPRGLASPISGC